MRDLATVIGLLIAFGLPGWRMLDPLVITARGGQVRFGECCAVMLEPRVEAR